MISVEHRSGAYPVEFAPLATLFGAIEGRCFCITDSNVHRHYGARIPQAWATHVAPPGEASKSLVHFEQCLAFLADGGARRTDRVVAFGGGVVGDLAGFVAATYMRGVPYVQVPTTLLAQVDSSVGGKVGIDLPQGKNLVGCFHQPASVGIDVGVLRTLDARQFNNGAAEVWKYGFALDGALLERLERGPLSPDDPDLADVVAACVRTKARVVKVDEFDVAGVRAKLNFGHTVGHALEQALGYEGLLHGEAIAIGMVAEARLGERLGVTPAGLTGRVQAALERQGLPVSLPEGVAFERLARAMRLDKKAVGDRLAFVLLTGPGASTLVSDVSEAEASKVLQQA